MKRTLLFVISVIVLVGAFVADMLVGSVVLPWNTIFDTSSIYHDLFYNFRLPKALTAVITGAAISVSGLVMQTLFRNPLAGPYVLGVSSGAGLGVAIYILLGSLLPLVFVQSGWGLIISAVMGAVAVLMLVLSVSSRVKDSVKLLIVGMMFGQIAGAFVNILQNVSNPDSLKLFVMWTFGDLSAVSWTYMRAMVVIVAVGFLLLLFVVKALNGLLLGENYAQSLGVSVVRTRIICIVSIAFLAGGVTAFTGPIAFIGVAVPFFVRGIWKSSNHAVTLPATMVVGAILLLVCDIISQLGMSGYVLPINAVSSIIGVPIIVWITLSRKVML